MASFLGGGGAIPFGRDFFLVDVALPVELLEEDEGRVIVGSELFVEEDIGSTRGAEKGSCV